MTNSMTMIDIRFKHSYGDFDLDVEIQVPARGVTVLFGPSGSGKTTLLRFLAGLEYAQQGRLTVAGVCWQDNDVYLPTHRRPLGFVFQEASLLPHLSVQDNLLYALKRTRVASDDGKINADSLREENHLQILALLGIEALLQRMPNQLSGGERQRVAIARALLTRPQLLLMDEPLASLDQQRKREIFPYLEKLRTELEIPIICVTHSMSELSRLADNVVVLEQGRVVSSGELIEVLAQLDSPLQQIDDAGSVIDATVLAREDQWHLSRAGFNGGELWLADEGLAVGDAIRVRVMARDVSITLSQHDDSSILNTLPAKVIEIAPAAIAGALLVKLSLTGHEGDTILVSRITQRSAEKLNLLRGMQVWAQIKSVAVLH